MPRPVSKLVSRIRLPGGAGAAALLILIVAGLGYGVVRGGSGAAILSQLRDAREALASAAGFRIATVGISGEKEITRDEILAAAGVTGRASLLFLDAEAARARLKSNPWVAEATLLKLYPDRLDITVVEREAFALWQKDGRVGVIAADGTLLQPFVDSRFAKLPLVVGTGAEKKAHDFLGLLDRYPLIRNQVQAAVLVADRRWNLRLKNGLDIKLPEADAGQAFDMLLALDRDKKILTRDITAIDLRLSDRVTVRLSDDAAAARAQMFKDKKAKRKGSDA